MQDNSNVRPTVGSTLLYLTTKDVEDTKIRDSEVIELTRVALTAHGQRRCEMPAKIGLHPLRDTLMHAMPAYVPAAHACGMKWSSSFPDNAKLGLAQTSGLLILNDEASGWPIAIMNSHWITAKRTAAVSALACEHLARSASDTLAIIGCGIQGTIHCEMLPLALPALRQIRVFDTRREAAETLVEKQKKSDIAAIVASSVEEAVRDADVVVSATAILHEPIPVVRHKWIKDNALVLPLDFDSAWEWETLTRADKFVVDSVDEMEYFRTIGYLRKGLPFVHAEIGEVVAGQRVGRESDGELIVDMNIGMAVEDVVLAREIYARAIEIRAGRELPL